jgi:hypothetical protein
VRNRMPTGDAWFANQIAGSTELAVAAGTITAGALAFDMQRSCTGECA